MIVYLLLIVLSLLAVHIFIRHRRFGRMINKIPGPLALPFIGNIWQLFGNTEHFWYALHKIIDSHYPIAKIWFSTSALVLICHPDDLEVLLSSKIHTQKGSIYSILSSWFQDGVVISKGEKWRKRRKLLSSTFNLDNLKKYVDATNRCANEMIAKIKSDGQESKQEVSSIFYKPLLYVFCDASLNTDLRKFSDDLAGDYNKGMNDLFEISMHRLVRPYIMNWMMPFLSIGKKQKNALESVFRLRRELVNGRRQYHENTNYRSLKDTDSIVEVSGESKKKLSLLDCLLLAEKEGRIDKQGVNEEVDAVIIGGHETLSSMMVFVVMLLAENKEAQELARKEVNEVFEKANGKITLDEIQKLEYVDRCIKEAMRLYPVAPLFLRYMQEDLHLKNYTIPAGVDVMCMIYATHRDPKFWPNPNEYDPDRFLPHLVEKRHPYAYVPFSAGIRNCAGQKFAMVQMKILTAKILYNFYLEPVDLTRDLRFFSSITLHSTKPVYTKFVVINK